MQNRQSSPLLRLPPELRNQIYEYVLGGEIYYLLDSSGRMILIKNRYNGARRPQKHCFALLETCRQLHAETASLPSSLNTFASSSLTIANFFSKLTTAQQEAVKGVRLYLQWYLKLEWSETLGGDIDFAFLGGLGGLRIVDVRVFDLCLNRSLRPSHHWGVLDRRSDVVDWLRRLAGFVWSGTVRIRFWEICWPRASISNNSSSPDQSYMGSICTTSPKRRRRQPLTCDSC
jgi:hypothetical protein